MNTHDFDIVNENKHLEIKICRCCLSTERKITKIILFHDLLMELCDINVSEADGLPEWICWECAALLRKSVKFKRKVQQAQTLLYEHHNKYAQFSIDRQKPELKTLMSSHLSTTSTSTLDTTTSHDGYYKAIEHENVALYTFDDKEMSGDFEGIHEIFVKTELGLLEQDGDGILENRVNKSEVELQQLEPEVILKEGKKRPARKVTTEKPIDEEHKSNKSEVEVQPLEPEVVLKEERRRPARRATRKLSKMQTQSGEEHKDCAPTQRKKRIVKKSMLHIDETKIKIVKLDLDEQLRQREEESKATFKFPFHCHLCFKGFNFESKLNNHMGKHSPSRGEHKCEVCSMYLPNVHRAAMHARVHTLRYECGRCGLRTRDRLAILNHYRSQHEGVLAMYTCHICGKVSNNEKTHSGHMRNIHYTTRVKCDECGKTFTNKDSLSMHQLVHQNVKNYECEQCGNKFRTRSQIRAHMYRHTDDRNFYCVECDVRFKSMHTLRHHLKKSAKHQDINTLKFGCELCDKRFDSASRLTRHVRVTHEGVREHRCAQCGAAFSLRNSLNRHVRAVHAGQRAPLAHVCDTCGKQFRAKCTLVNHVRTHTGEKPFACEECGRRFAQHTAMRTHVKLVHLKMSRRAKVKPKMDPDILMTGGFVREDLAPAFVSTSTSPRDHTAKES